MTYWDIQSKLILELNELGFPFKLRDRLNIFALYTRLTKMARKNPRLEDKVVELHDLLEWLVELRKAGLEPPLDKARRRYVAE